MLFSTTVARAEPSPAGDMGTWRHTLFSVSQEDGVSGLPLNCSTPSLTELLDEVTRCAQANCSCSCFQPGKVNMRSCEQCAHGWVAHAVGMLSVQQQQVEIVQARAVLGISSLLLYGAQAVPVRMKILLDRLFSVLRQDEVTAILTALGWTLRDYVRGYILQDSVGKVLDRWLVMSQEEEAVTLQQFLRFGETKSIVELMAIQEQSDRPAIITMATKRDLIKGGKHCTSPRSENSRVRGHTLPSLHHFENLPGGSLAFLLPFQYVSPSGTPLLGPRPASSLTSGSPKAAHRLRQPGWDKQSATAESSESNLAASHSAGRTSHSPNPNSGTGRGYGERTGRAPLLKSEPDTSTYGSLKLQRGGAGEGASLVRTHPCAFSSSYKTAGARERRLGAAARKGRVSCGSCGKTFYDKGTLKIHHNAVHLRIKHRCTVDGCSMVFSSLRSRNRHSANPNPRLHAPSATHRARSPPGPRPGEVDPRLCPAPVGFPSSPPLEAPHAPLIFPATKAVQPVLPFYRTLLSPRKPENASVAMPPGPVVAKSSNDATTSDEQRLAQECQASSDSQSDICESSLPAAAKHGKPHSRGEPAPKKKPRKSSMPVKIKREDFSKEEGFSCHGDDSDADVCENVAIEVHPITGLMVSHQHKLLSTHFYPGASDGQHGRGNSEGKQGHVDAHNSVSCKTRDNLCPFCEPSGHSMSRNHRVHGNGLCHNDSGGDSDRNPSERAGSQQRSRGLDPAHSMDRRFQNTGRSVGAAGKGRNERDQERESREADKLAERKAEELNQALLCVKDEVHDPTYDLYSNRRYSLGNRAMFGVVTLAAEATVRYCDAGNDDEEERHRKNLQLVQS